MNHLIHFTTLATKFLVLFLLLASCLSNGGSFELMILDEHYEEKCIFRFEYELKVPQAQQLLNNLHGNMHEQTNLEKLLKEFFETNSLNERVAMELIHDVANLELFLVALRVDTRISDINFSHIAAILFTTALRAERTDVLDFFFRRGVSTTKSRSLIAEHRRSNMQRAQNHTIAVQTEPIQTKPSFLLRVFGCVSQNSNQA